MKKILLALTFGISTVAFAQADLGVTLNSPMANDVIGPNSAFTVSFDVTNPGTEDIDLLDTVFFQMSLNGSPLSVNGGTRFYVDSVSIPANGGTYAISFPPLTLNIPGQTMTTMSFCVDVEAEGIGWTGVADADLTNNQDCATVTYDPNTIGISENGLVATVEAKLIDNSFFANGIYHVEMSNVVASSTATAIAVYDLTGKEVFNAPLSVSANAINEEVSLNLNKGIYIVTIKGNDSILSSKKIVVQ